MKRYGIPLIAIILDSLVLYLFRTYTFFAYKETFMLILTNIFLFLFGVYMSQKSSKSSGWFKKTLIIALIVCLLIIQLGVLKNSLLNIILAKMGANSVIFYMLYIYFGYIFL